MAVLFIIGAPRCRELPSEKVKWSAALIRHNGVVGTRARNVRERAIPLPSTEIAEPGGDTFFRARTRRKLKCIEADRVNLLNALRRPGRPFI